jgi:rhamnosyl/mannosyltransferase
MHVVHLGKFYWPYHRGIETYLKLLCERLLEGCDLDVLVANTRWRTVVETINGVDVTRLGRLAEINSTSLCWQLPARLRRLRPDIVHVHLPNPWAEWCYFAAGCPGKLVVSFHSDIIRQKMLLRLHAPVHRRFLAKAARVLVATPRHIEFSPFLSQLPADRCTVIPYGIDIAQYRATEEVTRRATELRAQIGAPLILFVGHLVYYKGVDVLLDAMRDVAAHAVIVGRGPLEAHLRARADALGISRRVHFLGEVSEEELRALYHACDVFCLPSTQRSEAFGIVQLEAFACGKPVVSTNLPSGVPWVNLHEQTGLIVEPGDARSLAAALTRLLSNDDFRSACGQRAYQRVCGEFSADRMAAATLQVYSDVIGT